MENKHYAMHNALCHFNNFHHQAYSAIKYNLQHSLDVNHLPNSALVCCAHCTSCECS